MNKGIAMFFCKFIRFIARFVIDVSVQQHFLTLDKFEEASRVVKEVTLETKLVYSDYLSAQTGNKVYLKPENMQFTGAYKVRGAYYKISTPRKTVLPEPVHSGLWSRPEPPKSPGTHRDILFPEFDEFS